MSKGDSKPTIKELILECLSDGQKTTADIQEYLQKKKPGSKPNSVSKVISELNSRKEIEQKGRANYALPTVGDTKSEIVQDTPAVSENSRGEAENTETINKMLNLYDVLLDTVAVSIQKEDWDGIVEKIETIKSLRWLGATVDQLMKRWYLVHRGYDNNTRQAQEDAKHKTAEREKQETSQLPPDKRIKVIRSYDVTMQELIENLPGKLDHEV